MWHKQARPFNVRIWIITASLHKELSPDSTVPLCSTGHFSIFELIVLVFLLQQLFRFTLTAHFWMQHGAVFSESDPPKNLVHLLLSTKQQTNMIGHWLVNIVEHLDAKEPDRSLRSWWRPKMELKERTLSLLTHSPYQHKATLCNCLSFKEQLRNHCNGSLTCT